MLACYQGVRQDEQDLHDKKLVFILSILLILSEHKLSSQIACRLENDRLEAQRK